MSTFDLAVMGGIVVDGSGLERRRGDVGVKDGRIARIGFVDPGDADEVIDADGLHVAPGIVDAHTHYDPQLTFEPYATSSCYHGVTTVLAGNCGFSVAPNLPDQRDFLARMFARVEGMSPVALSAVDWGFESFPEFLQSRESRLGVNMACYVGHSAVRRTVMKEAGSEREATADEIEQMRKIVEDAMDAGAAGFSSSHGPTQLDGDDVPVPSRFSSMEELEVLCREAGRHRGGSLSYLHRSSIGGLDAEDKELLFRLGTISRLPIILQGLGGRSKVDVPGADWDSVVKWIEESGREGVGIYSLLRNHPFDRDFDFFRGTNLYEGVPSWHPVAKAGPSVEEKLALLHDEGLRNAMRTGVENPNKDGAKGSTLPPPGWKVVYVDEVAKPEHDKLLNRSIADIASEQGVTPADAMLDLAVDENLQTVFRYVSKNRTWEEVVAAGQKHPAMIIGVSDGGAHLERDDGADWSTAFLAFWVREKNLWSLEEGIRQLTQVPAALLGFVDRGMLLPGYWADMFIFDPDTISLVSKKQVHDFPGGEARYSARPQGVAWTIANGVPIVKGSEVLTGNLPGQVVRPGVGVSPSARFSEVAAKVRNWGRWGRDDQLGTLNLVDDEVRRRAASCVRSGRAIALGLELSERHGIQSGIIPGRLNPVRTLTHLNTPLSDDPDWICSNEDIVIMGTQAATHWDALSHVSYGGYLYNGHPASAVTAAGASRCGIHLVRTLVSRGVLLDVARAKGVDVLDPGYAIQPEDLDAACALGRVSVESGDIVLVRTGQMAHLRSAQRDLVRYAWPSPGLTMSTAEWFHSHAVAAVATDTLPLEVFPGEEEGTFLPVHLLHLVEMGMTQGQNWVLDELADDSADDGVYAFLLDASPLPFLDGTGSPLNPVAVK